MTTPTEVWLLMRGFTMDRHERRREVSEATDLPFVRVKALRWIAREPVTLGELSRMLVNDRPYTTLIVNALEERGLVTREAHPEDRRRKLVTITEAGKRVVEKAEAILFAPPPELSALDPDDLATLDRIMRKL
ncbi:MarR family winged helix-turn-helix transcriptional regulator [Sciscionella sediminilitoris]|uniref:MarR family winged helix-turn-helix transcriptional regulator n=1 Tax=Sciscionella sediminilitoris TaxID=1445613 RepID=UPI0004DF6DFA|nr:MarR family transcriptional regulator [Sciscionella sp. SE31]